MIKTIDSTPLKFVVVMINIKVYYSATPPELLQLIA
jgi:hypothetical protein